MQGLTLSVTQLNNYIKNIIDGEEILFNVSVYGEVSNFKISGGNAYFDIKEEGSQLSCIKFGMQYADINNGDKVLLTGRLNFHPKFGKLSFVASRVEPYGMGALYQKFLELKARLEANGIFDERHKKQIPSFAKKIGVVTSATGAVIHDIIHVTRKNNPYTDILLYPVKVQGEGAETEIASGIKYLDNNSDVDVIIVARGGGSFEDLSPFNTEEVAMAVFECNKPIVSGVGHETDFSLCDFASDLRAPTPSVAAEVCVFNYYNEIDRIGDLIASAKFKIDVLLKDKETQVSSLADDIIAGIAAMLHHGEAEVLQNINQIKTSITNLLFHKQKALELLTLKIEKDNPLSILKQGYSKTFLNNNVLKSIKEICAGAQITTYLADGKIESKVINIKGEHNDLRAGN